MNRALFVSDIHISKPDDPKCRLFLRLLQACEAKSIHKLFLVGDIFDLWIADRRYFVGRYVEVIAQIKRLVESGCEVHYFEGNHDLDLKVFWQGQMGAHVYDRARMFDLDGLRVRVEHGDQMDPSDRGYLFLRWLLRTPVLRFLGRHLPDRLVQWIGTRASQASREYTSEVKTVDAFTARERIRAHARKVHDIEAFDLIVSGHVHIKEDSEHPGYRCVNLGTWLSEPEVFELNGREGAFHKVDDWILGT